MLNKYGIWHLCGISGGISCWHIHGNSIVNESCTLLSYLQICAVMLGLYVEYSRHAVGQTHTMCQAYCAGTYANNAKCMYHCATAHTVDYSEFIYII